MSNLSLRNVASEVASDLASILGIPTTVLGRILRSYIEREQEVALNILLDELGKGNIDDLYVAAEDDRVAIIYQYFLAARNGAARRNLRLLARSVAGLASRDKLFSDEFNKYQYVLARITRDQILVIGCYFKEFSQESQRMQNVEQAREAAWKNTEKKLVPANFPTEQHLKYILNQAAALGLIVPGSGFGKMVYSISPLLEEITELADFADVLAEGDKA